MHVQNLGYSVLKIVAPKPPIFDIFRQLCNLTKLFNGPSLYHLAGVLRSVR